MRNRSSHSTRFLLLALALAVASAGCSSNGKGPGKSVQFAKRQLFVNPYESTAVADLDKDGHVDIVYGAYWFAGPDFVPRTFRPNHVAGEYMRANSDHILDVDKDGWLDVIAGGWGEDGIYWYKNPGKGPQERNAPWEMHQPWKAHLLAKTRGHMEMFALHDFDGDGVPELLFGLLPQEGAARDLALEQGRRTARRRLPRSCWAPRAVGTASPSATSTATGARTC